MLSLLLNTKCEEGDSVMFDRDEPVVRRGSGRGRPVSDRYPTYDALQESRFATMDALFGERTREAEAREVPAILGADTGQGVIYVSNDSAQVGDVLNLHMGGTVHMSREVRAMFDVCPMDTHRGNCASVCVIDVTEVATRYGKGCKVCTAVPHHNNVRITPHHDENTGALYWGDTNDIKDILFPLWAAVCDKVKYKYNIDLTDVKMALGRSTHTLTGKVITTHVLSSVTYTVSTLCSGALVIVPPNCSVPDAVAHVKGALVMDFCESAMKLVHFRRDGVLVDDVTKEAQALRHIVSM